MIAATSARSLEGKRVLILEDDFYLATDEKALVEQAGATVIGPFGSALTDRVLPGPGEVDAALVDINLGNGPNFATARALSERGVPFLFVTGYDEAVVPQELSHVHRIEKPIRELELIAALDRLVRPEPASA